MTLTSLLDRWTEEAWAEHARGDQVAAQTYWRCREDLARTLEETD